MMCEIEPQPNFFAFISFGSCFHGDTIIRGQLQNSLVFLHFFCFMGIVHGQEWDRGFMQIGGHF
jgi:hypothetical protein